MLKNVSFLLPKLKLHFNFWRLLRFFGTESISLLVNLVVLVYLVVLVKIKILKYFKSLTKFLMHFLEQKSIKKKPIIVTI